MCWPSAATGFYLATAVLTTTTISLLLQGVSGTELGAQIDAVGVAGVEASISPSGSVEVRLESAVPMAFAVELYELGFEPGTDRVLMHRTVVPVRVRNSSRVVNRARVVPAEIGGPDGDLFI